MDSLEVTSELEKYRLNIEIRDGHTLQLIHSPTSGLTTQQIWKRRRHLGSGGFGEVWQEGYEDEYQDWHYRAVKICSITKMKSRRIDYKKELSTLAAFSFSKSSDLFVNLYGWWKDSENIFFAMEHLRFGDLSKYVASKISEEEVKQIIDNILRGLEVMHGEGYAHRDIKPENILVVEKRPEFPRWRVKIADFGISKQVLEGSGTVLHTMVGTTGYCAPEILGQSGYQESSIYTSKVDMWSLGCVLFNISSQGHVPFSMLDLGKYCDGKIALNSRNVPTCLSDVGMSFVKALLQAQPEARPTPTEALRHSWLTTVSIVVSKNSQTISPKLDSNKRCNYNTFLSSLCSTSFPLSLNQRSPTMHIATAPLAAGAPEISTVAQTLPRVIHSGDGEQRLERSHATQSFSVMKTGNKSRPRTAEELGSSETAVLGGDSSHNVLQQHEFTLNTNASRHSAVSDITQEVSPSESSWLVRQYERNRVRIQETDKIGNTALRSAAKQGQPEFVEKSWGCGADIDIKNDDGESSIYFAALQDQPEVTGRLVERSADVCAKYSSSQTPLHDAAQKGQLKMARWLVEQGADVGVRDGLGWTPLYYAVYLGQLEVARWLVERGAGVCVKDNSGRTPLHDAAQKGQLQMARWLVEQGADVVLRDEIGRTPRHIATQKGQLQMAKWLREQEVIKRPSTRWKKKLFRTKRHVQVGALCLRPEADHTPTADTDSGCSS